MGFIPDIAKNAEKEGETAAAVAFKPVAKIEAHHRERYVKLLEMEFFSTYFKNNSIIISLFF